MKMKRTGLIFSRCLWHCMTMMRGLTRLRTNLEAVFNMDGFLKYLAVNGTIQNWDTYGRMIHNFYLYNDPATGLLTWIPWDNNEAMSEGKQGGALALNFSNIDAGQWPLIEKTYADDVYKAQYGGYLSQIVSGEFELTSMQALYAVYGALVEPYATTERAGYTFLSSPATFSTAIAELCRMW